MLYMLKFYALEKKESLPTTKFAWLEQSLETCSKRLVELVVEEQIGKIRYHVNILDGVAQCHAINVWTVIVVSYTYKLFFHEQEMQIKQ